MSFQHILVPTDFSTLSNDALTYAFREAELHGAMLTLLHVLQYHEHPEVHYIRGNPALPRDVATDLGRIPIASLEPVTVSRDYVEEAKQKLRGLVPPTFSQPSHTLVEHGHPADAIVQVAVEHTVDLIVMVTHGRTGLSHMWLGSVTEKVIRSAPCPVLTIRRRLAVAI